MPSISKEIRIEAPPERVFSYMEDPMNLLEIWPSMVDISDVERLPNGGHRYHWRYKMAGMPFEGDSETVEIVPNERFVQKNETGIPSRFDWAFAPEDGGTKVTMSVEYEVPKSLLGKLAEPFVVKLNEREAGTVLSNLKDRIES